MLPAFPDGRLIVIRAVADTCPAKENPSAVRRLKGLGRIKIKSQIPLPEFLVYIPDLAGIRQSYICQVTGLIDICKPVLFRFNSLGTESKNRMALYLKIIRTFPHIAKWLCRRNGLQKPPCFFILRPVQKRLSKAASGSGPKKHVITALVFPHLRIPHMTA